MLQVIEARDLAGGMARQRQRQFLGRDSDPVVTHAAELDPALLDIDVHRRRAGVEAVFQQFLQHGCRALYDLAGGDLIDQLGWQLRNGHAGIL